MRTLSIMQPVYIPWLGYFEQMALADEFVFLDDAQYTKQDWRNRNQVRGAKGAVRLTVPVHRDSLNTRICDIRINNQTPWQRKHLSTLSQLYAKSGFKDEMLELVSPAIEKRHDHLSNLTCEQVVSIARHIGIQTPVTFSSAIQNTNPGRLERLVDIANLKDCDTIYIGKAARDYMDEDTMRKNGIEIIYQDYQHPEYKQVYSPFLPFMSVVDLIANVGPASLDVILSSPRPSGLQS